MGTSIEKVYTARALADIGLLPAGALIVDLGAQNFNGGIDPIKLENTLANFLPEQTFSQEVLDQIAGRASLKEIFSLLGFDYRCIDAYETEAGIVLDLNQDPTPEDLRGAVDIVQNFGTTEHVLNQTNCFTMIHEMTKPGGIMWHALPMSDFYTHGFFKYDIVFFIALARSNNYEIKEMTFGKSASAHPIPEFLFENVLPAFKIECCPVRAGTSAPARMRELIKEKGRPPRLVFVESPSNPTMVMTEIREVRKVADECGQGDQRPLVAVDNTFLGPVFQHPLQHGADLVLYSLTKFVGGHSDLIAGAVIGSNALIKGIKDMRTILGPMPAPFTAWLATRSLETVQLRMSRQAQTAEIIAEMLILHPAVADVTYPSLLGGKNPQRAIYKRQCNGPGGIISFDLGTKKRAFKFLDSLAVATLAVSLGGNETLAEHPGTMTHADVAPERQRAIGIGDGLVRISVGIEDPKDLLADFEQALSRLD